MKNVRRALSTGLLLALLLPGAAQACSQDDTAYFDGFLDPSCLEALNSTTLDTFGGLRLTTNGTPIATAWDTAADFDTGIGWESGIFAPVGVRTLATETSGGTGAPAKLVLPPTLLPLDRDAANPVLDTETATVADDDNIDDPSVVKVGSTYLMWYSGTAEDGGGPAILLAESSNGQTWSRLNSGEPVLQGTPGAFDEHGVSGPDVVYDPDDAGAPYKLWYGGDGEVFGAIGYATSTDGISWTKHDDPDTVAATDPVLEHGPAGSPDSFAAADPAVLEDGATWKMWYTGDDSNKKRIAYATSADGIEWTKGGKVIAPEDPGSNANYDFGVFAPTVWKSGSAYKMLLGGRKNIGTAINPIFQTRVMNASSSDGISWSAPSPTLNPQSNRFDSSNLNSPDILEDPGSASAYKLYYSGNAIDANGNFHSRIGLATSANANSFARFDGSAGCLKCVLDIGALGTAFDARQTSGLSVAAPAGGNPKLVGFYWGSRGSDFKPRLGEATSADGSAWTRVPVSGPAGGAVFPLGNSGFDQDGARDPSVLYEQNAAGGIQDYFLYFTALNGGGRSIGFASALEDAGTKQPDNNSWSARSQVLAPTGSGFEGGGVSQPSLIHDGANYVLYYTATDSAGTTSIGRAVSATGPGGAFGSRAQVTLTGSSQGCDPDGRLHPVVLLPGAADYRMLYTGIEKLEGRSIERACYATSSDGIAWDRKGVVLNPSQVAFSDDEVGVEPTGMLVDGTTLRVYSSGIDRTGRTRGDHATTAYPTPGSPTSGIPNGSATYQLGDETTAARDFRSISRTSSGGGLTLWMSYEQPYSTGGSGGRFWSDYFPVTVGGTSEALSFLLSIHGVRWQARLAGPAGSPALDRVEISHAPVQFMPAGSATTKAIAPPPGISVGNWSSLTVSGSLFSPTGSGNGSGTIKVLSADGSQELVTQSLSTNGDTTIDLSGVSAQANPTLLARLELASASPFSATPLVHSLKVLYNTAPPTPTPVTTPPPPPPPPPPTVLCQGVAAKIVGTAGADVLRGTARADVIASLGGNDRVKGLGGNDRVCGGGGKDRLYGEGGSDRLAGQAGRDTLIGGAGRKDLCNGGGGTDLAEISCERKRRIP